MTGLRLRWNDPHESVFEGFLSRGDRRIAGVLERAFRKGAKFDAWGEQFDLSIWEEAFDEEGLSIPFYTYRKRPIDEVFPWEHIDVAVTRKFLTEDYLMSKSQETRIDCRHKCFACGILPKLREIRRDTEPEAWECPTVRKRPNHVPREVKLPDTSIPLPMVS
ncbi:MAG: B12-binding domain-containing radical SAM protein, partial [Chloroflexota bacterium]